MSSLSTRLLLIILSLLFAESPNGLQQKTGTETVRIPLKQAGRLYLIEATVDGQRGNFVFDTGATHLVLNKTYFRNYSPARNLSSGIGGSGQLSGETRINQMQIGPIELKNIIADVTNLGQIENQRQVKILGLIGMDVLKEFELWIDFRQQSLELHSLKTQGDSQQMMEDSFEADLICEVALRNNIMFVSGEVNGQVMDFCLDTGAETNVICSSCRKDILTKVKINRKTSLTGIGGQSTEVFYGALTDLSVGSKQMAPMQTIVTSLAALSAAYDFPIDGVLGFDFFARGKIRINLHKKELAIKFY